MFIFVEHNVYKILLIINSLINQICINNFVSMKMRVLDFSILKMNLNQFLNLRSN